MDAQQALERLLFIVNQDDMDKLIAAGTGQLDGSWSITRDALKKYRFVKFVVEDHPAGTIVSVVIDSRNHSFAKKLKKKIGSKDFINPDDAFYGLLPELRRIVPRGCSFLIDNDEGVHYLRMGLKKFSGVSDGMNGGVSKDPDFLYSDKAITSVDITVKANGEAGTMRLAQINGMWLLMIGQKLYHRTLIIDDLSSDGLLTAMNSLIDQKMTEGVAFHGESIDLQHICTLRNQMMRMNDIQLETFIGILMSGKNLCYEIEQINHQHVILLTHSQMVFIGATEENGTSCIYDLTEDILDGLVDSGFARVTTINYPLMDMDYKGHFIPGLESLVSRCEHEGVVATAYSEDGTLVQRVKIKTLYYVLMRSMREWTANNRKRGDVGELINTLTNRCKNIFDCDLSESLTDFFITIAPLIVLVYESYGDPWLFRNNYPQVVAECMEDGGLTWPLTAIENDDDLVPLSIINVQPIGQTAIPESEYIHTTFPEKLDPIIKPDTATIDDDASIIYLLYGTSGCGKTTLLQTPQFNGVVVCSADHHFTDDDGVYTFKKELLKEAHGRCTKKARKNIQAGHSVVIDNTNMGIQSWKPYLDIARETGSRLVLVTADPALLFDWTKTNVHNVDPLTQINQMRKYTHLPFSPFDGDSVLMSTIGDDIRHWFPMDITDWIPVLNKWSQFHNRALVENDLIHLPDNFIMTTMNNALQLIHPSFGNLINEYDGNWSGVFNALPHITITMKTTDVLIQDCIQFFESGPITIFRGPMATLEQGYKYTTYVPIKIEVNGIDFQDYLLTTHKKNQKLHITVGRSVVKCGDKIKSGDIYDKPPHDCEWVQFI